MAHTNPVTGALQPDYTIFYKDYCTLYPPLDVSGFVSVTIEGKVYDFQHMFEERNAYREIGMETPELFHAIAPRFIKEAQCLYNDKIRLWADNLSAKLWSRVTTDKTMSEDTVVDYLNPTVGDPAHIGDNTPQSAQQRTTQYNVTANGGLSQPELMRQINALDNIYMDALRYLDRLFIGLY